MSPSTGRSSSRAAPTSTASQQQLNKSARVRTVDPVGYANVSGFTAKSGGATLGSTTQTTGEGKVLGITPTYWKDFPALLRPMLGATEGILIAQQTAANLHVSVGDTVSVTRIGLPPVKARIDGVIDLPQADALFQAVGVPPGAAPQAPPDNVLVVPMAVWHQWFDQQAVVRPGTVHTQLHVRLDHTLPPDPRRRLRVRPAARAQLRGARRRQRDRRRQSRGATRRRERRRAVRARPLSLPRPAGRDPRHHPHLRGERDGRRSPPAGAGAAARARRDDADDSAPGIARGDRRLSRGGSRRAHHHAG